MATPRERPIPAGCQPSRTRRIGSAALVATTVLVASAGCASKSTAQEPTSTTVTSIEAGTWEAATAEGAPPAGDAFCPPSMPGEEMSASEAVVRFSPTQICPGYVTVRPSTPITFENLGDSAAEVTILDGVSADAERFTSTTLEPGEAKRTMLAKPGSVFYRVSAIESFRGTIEVLDSTQAAK